MLLSYWLRRPGMAATEVGGDIGWLSCGKEKRARMGGWMRKRYGVNPLSQLQPLFIQGPIFIIFFLAIRNMAEEKVHWVHWVHCVSFSELGFEC
ncbi:unnamed protein product [Prunus armeniaca]|uniref:Uncharacterized protein n=1 Tax=Prunus armeniaca TaxID=36596 RepID=A0A6J5WKZ7_PRUAR|nr:unnamed protein product [Prunus armeniaca]